MPRREAQAARAILLVLLALTPCVAAISPLAAADGEEKEKTRSVIILQDRSPPPLPEFTAPGPQPPAPPPQAVPEPPPVPAPVPATAAAPSAAGGASGFDNNAGISLDIMPGADLQVGARIKFRIGTRKQGYLILVDVDPTGKVSQIYPNPRSLMMAKASSRSANLIRPGKDLMLPEADKPYAGFEFVATPPTGTAFVIALLSDKPVQMLDLPDVPQNLVGQTDSLHYLEQVARSLKVADPNGSMQDVTWSIDAKPYRIQ